MDDKISSLAAGSFTRTINISRLLFNRFFTFKEFILRLFIGCFCNVLPGHSLLEVIRLQRKRHVLNGSGLGREFFRDAFYVEVPSIFVVVHVPLELKAAHNVATDEVPSRQVDVGALERLHSRVVSVLGIATTFLVDQVFCASTQLCLEFLEHEFPLEKEKILD